MEYSRDGAASSWPRLIEALVLGVVRSPPLGQSRPSADVASTVELRGQDPG